MRREQEGKEKNRISVSASFKTGIIALLFLIVGYESASFVGKVLAKWEMLESDASAVTDAGQTDSSGINTESYLQLRDNKKQSVPSMTRHIPKSSNDTHRPVLRENRRVESFRFDPNTVNFEELCRLGFSQKQAQSIINYRSKGGRFHRKSDFAKSFVVSDSIYERLEPYIEIPLVDINEADSAALDNLPGIGPYYAAKIVEYRRILRGYSYKEQLMDIWKFDEAKFEGLKDLIEVGPGEPYPLWHLPEDSLKTHPYIGKYAAHGIIVYKENTPPEEWSVSMLESAGILSSVNAAKLARCRLE